MLDFYCPTANLALEIDGGGHAEDGQAAYDTERADALERHGVRILRFWNHDVWNRRQSVLEQIWQALDEPTEG